MFSELILDSINKTFVNSDLFHDSCELITIQYSENVMRSLRKPWLATCIKMNYSTIRARFYYYEQYYYTCL